MWLPFSPSSESTLSVCPELSPPSSPDPTVSRCSYSLQDILSSFLSFVFTAASLVPSMEHGGRECTRSQKDLASKPGSTSY